MKLKDVVEFIQAVSPYWEQIEKEIMYEREHNYPSVLGKANIKEGADK